MQLSSVQMGPPPVTERSYQAFNVSAWVAWLARRAWELPFPGFPDRETLHRFGLDPESAYGKTPRPEPAAAAPHQIRRRLAHAG